MKTGEIAFILVVLLPFFAGCIYFEPEDDISGGPPVSGEVDREGEVVQVTLYQQHHSQFSANQSASGFINTDDGPLLAYIELEFERLNNAIQDDAEELDIGHLGSGIDGHQSYGIGITWYETKTDGDEVEVFVHGYRDGGTATAEGTFYVDDTDWSDYLHGHLEAEIDHPEHGKRILELDWHWGSRP